MKKTLIALLLILALILTGCSSAAPKEGNAVADGVVEDNADQSQGTDSTPQIPQNPQTPSNPTQKPSDSTQTPSDSTPPPANQPSGSDQEQGGSTDAPDVFAPLNLWVSPVSGKAEKSRPISAVQWQYNEDDGQYYLCLPTELDFSAVQVWFAGAETCSFADKTVKNGETVSFLKVGKRKVTLGGSTYPLTIMKSANIGSMYITTQSGSMDKIHADKSNKETGTMRFVSADGKVLYNGELKEIKGRGNATWSKPKKPYQIKLKDKAELVNGAGKAGTWLLLANYCEKTMINNTVALNLAFDAGLKDSARSDYLDLYCNGTYMGTYQVSEKVQIAESRLELNDLEKTTEAANNGAKLSSFSTFGPREASKGVSKGYNIPKDPADITGGYLLEIEANDRYVDEGSGFVTSYGTAVVIKEPENASAAQVAYISNFFQEFEDALRAKDGINPKTGKRFDEYFDFTSLVKKYILEEFVKNIDADKTSQYFYKPSDKQSTVGFCGPVWDYDNSFDVMSTADKTDGLYAATRRKKIYYHLNKHDFFVEAVKKEWKENYLPAIAVCLGEKKPAKGASLQSLDSYYKMLAPSAAMNYVFWGEIDKPINTGHIDTGDTYEEHFDYLRSYLYGRRSELNSIWLNQ